jgi:cell division protein FtsZ
MTLFEVDQAANRIREEVDEEANIIFGSAIDSTLNGRIRVSVVATGIDSAAIEYRPKLELAASNDRPSQPAQVSAPAVAEMPLQATGTTGLQASGGFTPAFTPATPATSLWAQGQQASPVAQAPMQSVTQSAPPPSSAPSLRSPAGLPQRPASTRSLFAEPVSRQSEPAAPAPSVGTSLFNRVTGAIGKRASAPAASAAPAPVERMEPTAAAEPRPDAPAARPARPAAADEMGGLEIPAFLRRQQS